MPKRFTADQLSDIIVAALEQRDLESVAIALRLMAGVDPRRAAETLAALETGIALARGR